MFNKSKINIVINTFVRILSLILIVNMVWSSQSIRVEASVSTELGQSTTFLIEEYLATKELIVVVYDRETGLPIGQIRVELYYEDSKYPITGSNGQYLTDNDGYVDFKLSTLTMGDIYHIEIDTPGYYPYIGEDFVLTGDMNIIIYLDPIPVDEDEPVLPDEEDEDDEEPETPPTPPVPLPEEEQEAIPDDESDEQVEDKDDTITGTKTGDDTSVLYYALIGLTAALFMILMLLLKKRNEDEIEYSDM